MHKILLLTVLTVALISCIGGSCGDGPTGPGQIEDHAVYFLNGHDHSLLYSYYPATNRLDSIVLPFEIGWTYALSPHGDMLYACGWDSLYIVSLPDSAHVVDYIPGRYLGGVAISNDGSLMALSGFDLQILRTSDHSLVFSDTDQTFGGVFSDDGKRFYAVGLNDLNSLDPVYCVNLEDTTDVRRKTFPNNPYMRIPRRIVPYPDDRKLMVYFMMGSYEHSFEVYDQVTDSVLFSEMLTPGAGTITRHPNKPFAYYTNPGTLTVGPPPPSEFYRFDMDMMVRDRTVNTAGAFDDPQFDWWPVAEVAITPDGNWLVATHWGGLNELVAYDLRRGRFANFYRLESAVFIQLLQCQRYP